MDPDPLYVDEDTQPAPVLYASLLAAVIVLLPVAVVCLWVLGRARDVLRAIAGRVTG